MKKLLAIVVSLLLIVSIIPLGAINSFADDLPGTVIVEADPTSDIKEGDTVEIYISLEDFEEGNSGYIRTYFDEDVFELTDFDYDTSVSGIGKRKGSKTGTKTVRPSSADMDGNNVFSWMYSSEYGSFDFNTSELLTLTLTAIADVTEDQEIRVNAMINYAEGNTKTNVGNAWGSVTIEGASAAHVHTLVPTAAVAATCTTAGNIAYYTCSDCGLIFSDAEGTNEITLAETVVPATGHTLVPTAAVAATCTTAGNTAYYTCSVCGKVFSDAEGTNEITLAETVVAATGHTLTKTEAVAATCEGVGNIAYYTCSVCGKLFTDENGENEITSAEVVVPATGHVLGKTEAVAATCSSIGNIEYYTCSVCNKIFSDAEGTNEIELAQTVIALNPANHVGPTEVRGAVEATCTAEGYTGDTYCTACNTLVETGTKIAKTAHTLTLTEAVAATCVATGNIAYYTCSECGKFFTDAAGENEITAEETVVAIDLTNHVGPTEVRGAAEATCTAEGYTGDTYCTACDTCIEKGTKIAKTAHTLTLTGAVAATCVATGNTAYYTCSECGKFFSDANGENEIALADTVIAIDPTNHVGPTEVRDAIAATKSAKGYTGDTYCTACNTLIAEGEETDALGFTVAIAALENANGSTVSINNGAASADGAVAKVAAKGAVTLTFNAGENVTFVAWMANGYEVSNEAEFTTAAVADVTYTAHFIVKSDESYVVTFYDKFLNPIASKTVAKGEAVNASDVVAPTLVGYTFTGWSLSAEELAALTADASVYAQYAIDEAADTYTVTADGATIITGGASYDGVVSGLKFDTRVTVSNESATAWKLNGAIVAYGSTYSFFVGANMTLEAVTDVVTAVPEVANIKMNEVTVNDKIRVHFIASASVPEDGKYTLVNAGFVYGKNIESDTFTLEDVDGSAVKAMYFPGNAEQFLLNYCLSAQTGTMKARAFIIYVDENNETVVSYADVMTYTYA